MTEQSVKFHSYDEVCSRPAFDPTYEISPSNFKGLIGTYLFRDDQICQVRTDKGICRQKHKNGWLGTTKSGVEALIGCQCAQNHFNASTEFKLEKNRVLDELARKEALAKMANFLSDKLGMATELVSLEQSIKAVERRMSAIYDLLPNDALTFLYQSQRTSNWDVFVDVQYIKELQYADNDEREGEEKNFKEQWIASRLGKVKPLSTELDIKSLLEKAIQLKKFYNSFSTLSTEGVADIRTTQLKKYVNRIDQKEEFKKLLFKMEKEVDDFLVKDNLEMLVYVCDSKKEQFNTVQAIMKLTGLKANHNSHIDRRLKSIIAEYEKRFDGRLIRKSITN
ncbi:MULTISPECIES: hypothetical protein [Serratia]|uniref:hypothetical protein n=1 Tax=Serratia TaxID=613 RepID=UPI0013DBB579|nr:hypothetical protein [Serratia marcescens]